MVGTKNTKEEESRDDQKLEQESLKSYKEDYVNNSGPLVST